MANESQTAALQRVVDNFPSCFFAEDAADYGQRLAKLFKDDAKGDEVLLSYANQLVLVGQELYNQGGSGPDPAHSGISGLYCKGSDGYTRFLGAYAQAFRRSYDLTIERTGVWNGELWANALKDTIEDIGKGVGQVGEGLGKGLGEAVLKLLPLLVVIAILAVVVLAISRKVAP